MVQAGALWGLSERRLRVLSSPTPRLAPSQSLGEHTAQNFWKKTMPGAHIRRACGGGKCSGNAEYMFPELSVCSVALRVEQQPDLPVTVPEP